MPEGYIDLLFSSEPGIIADRGLAALILGTIIIASSQVIRVWVSAIFLTVYVSLVRIFGALPLGGPVGGGDMLFGIFTGGIIAAAFMLLGDPVTGPKTRRGSAAAAVLAGFFAFILRYPGNEPFGAFYAIAMVNTLAPLIRGMENFFFFKKPETV
jgi:electron transport complex protein RnfD